MKTIATALAALVTASILTAAPAEAVRVVPGQPLADVCKNIKGKQTIFDVVYGPYDFKNRSTTKCVWTGRVGK